MSTTKRWTYKQVTEKAEEGIKRVIELAEANPELAHLYRSHAQGIHDMWYSLTVGWQDDGDSKRLDNLIPRVGANRS